MMLVLLLIKIISLQNRVAPRCSKGKSPKTNNDIIKSFQSVDLND